MSLQVESGSLCCAYERIRLHTDIYTTERLTITLEISFLQYLMMKDKVKIMKEEVKKMLLDADSFDLSDKLDCIDTLERLGLDYHYTKEIDKLMCNVFEARDQDLDLLTTSYLFYLLRKHGYHISSNSVANWRYICSSVKCSICL